MVGNFVKRCSESLVVFSVRNVGLISLVWEVPLEKGVATHPGITDLKFSMNTGAWRDTVCEVTKSWT